MKYRIPSRPMLSNPNLNRIIFSNTLHSSCRYSLLIRNTHHPRRHIWVINPVPPRKQSLFFLLLPVPSPGTRPILWLLYQPRNMKYWCYLNNLSNVIGLYRVRISMRTNKILGSFSYYQPPVSYPLYWENPYRMNLRGFCCG